MILFSMAVKLNESNPATGVVYFGVININEGSRNIGSVDIWRSVSTKKYYCDEKRIGALDISDKVGLHVIDENKKWAVAVNRKRMGSNRWRLIDLIKEGKQCFVDSDDESEVEVSTEDFNIVDSDWWSFLVEDNVNRTVDIAKDRLRNDAW